MVAGIQGAPLTDVLVVGGGPAGLAAAIAARQKGLRVTVADAANPPVDKACGEGIMPSGRDALAELGVELSPQDRFLFCGIRFVGRGVAAEAEFSRGPGLGVRRTTLHRILARRAADAGVVFCWGARVETPSGRPIRVNGKAIRYDWLVAADGQNSAVRRWADLDRGRGRADRYGFRRHFRAEPWSDCVEVYWGKACQLYVTPVAADEICVAVLSRNPQLRINAALGLFPEVRRQIEGAEPTSSERGGVCGNRSFRSVAAGRVALLGDASGSVDAITGDGLSLAFRQAIALASAMEERHLAGYAAVHQMILRPPTRIANLLLMLDRHAWLRQRVLERLRADPRLFQRLLAPHSPAHDAAPGVLQIAALGWRLLAP